MATLKDVLSDQQKAKMTVIKKQSENRMLAQDMERQKKSPGGSVHSIKRKNKTV